MEQESEGMTRILNSKGKEIPVLIDTMGKNALYIELRIFDQDGYRMGSVHNIIDREDAETLAKGILKWLDDTKKGGKEND